MFSKTCEYGIRAMIFIARHSTSGKKVGIKEISKGIDSPEYFIAKILQDLSRRGLVQSLKGPNGGFFLNNEDSQISLADIVEAIDGNKIFSGCGLGLNYCSESKPCAIHNEFKEIRKDIYRMMEAVKLGELRDHADIELTFIKHR